MAEIKVWRLFIRPRPDANPTEGDFWMFGKKKDGTKFSDDDLIEFGKKKNLEDIARGAERPRHPNHYVNKRNRIQRYWDYKKALKAVADIEGFVMPKKGAWVKFYVPMPKSWSDKKKKEMDFQDNEQTPDADNFYKAFADSLMKQDKTISDYRASKFWYSGKGHIEITLGELPPAVGYTKHIFRDKIIK